MSKAKTETKMDSFQSWAHRWGRVGTLIALIYMVGCPLWCWLPTTASRLWARCST